MIIRLLYLIFLLSIISCTEKKEDVKNDYIKGTSDKQLHKKPIEDSSNLVRVFENIYFGSKEKIEFGRNCSLAYLSFKYQYGGMYRDYGLYSFGLESEPICDYTTCLKTIDDIKNIITFKYQNPKKLKLVKEPNGYSELDKLFNKNKTENLLPPGDNFTNKFYEWKKNNITVDLSSTTFYRETGNTKATVFCPTSSIYQKYYIINIAFKYDKIINLIESNYKKELQGKVKFYRSGLNKDAAKF